MKVKVRMITYLRISNILPGFHLLPQFLQTYRKFPEPIKPVVNEKPLVPSVMFEEPHFGQVSLGSLGFGD